MRVLLLLYVPGEDLEVLTFPAIFNHHGSASPEDFISSLNFQLQLSRTVTYDAPAMFVADVHANRSIVKL